MTSDTPEGPPRSPSRSRPRSRYRAPAPRWTGLLALLLVYAAIFLPLAFQTPPEARPRSAPDSAFSAERAMEHVGALAGAPRPMGSPRHDTARAYLVRELDAMGLEVRVDSAVVLAGGGAGAVGGAARPVVAATVRNVLARLPGSGRAAGDPDAEDPGTLGALGAPPTTLAFMAHYDSRDLTPGAGDDATGVAAILEAVRALRAGPPLRNDLLVILTDGEESGLFGARSLLERRDPWVTAADLVINVEMRGAGGRAVLFQTGPGNLALVREAAAADPTLTGSSLYTEIYRRMPNDTDFTPFLRHGFTGLNFAGIEAATRYHHPSDTPDNLDPGTLQDHGNHLLALGRRLGAADLEPLTGPGPDAVFHDVPGLGMIVYPTTRALPLALLSLLLWAGALGWMRWRGGKGESGSGGAGLRWTTPAAGLAWAAVLVLLAGGAGWVVTRLSRAIRPGWGSLHGAAAWGEGPLFLLLVLAGVALALALLSVTLLPRAVRPAGDGGLALGAALPALLAGAALSVLAPGTGMVLVWPATIATGGAALTALLPRAGRAPVLRPLVLALPALAVAWLLVPLVRGLWVGLGISSGVVLGALAGLALTLALPLLAAVVRPLRVAGPALAVAPVALALALSLPARNPGPDRPLPSALLHLQDRRTGEARWAVPNGPPVPRWTADRVAPDGEPAALSTFLPSSWRSYRVGPAPRAEAPAPDVEVARVRSDRFRISVRSRVGAERISLFPEAAAGGRLRLLSVAGVPVAEPGVSAGGAGVSEAGAGAPEDRWEVIHLGHPLGGVLEVEVAAVAAAPGGAPAVLVLVEHRLRPWELLGASWPARPPGLAADIRSLTDRVLIRSEIELPGGRLRSTGLPAG